MKQKDVATIILIAGFAAVISFFLSSYLFSSGSHSKQQAAVIQPIDAAFKTPNTQYFNAKSIDPTLLIKIGGQGNNQPFQDSQS